jgi:hypothetical protein
VTSRSLSRTALLAVILQLATGCSFAMTRPPEPVANPAEPVVCNDSTSSPVLDTICAVIFLPAAINIARTKTCTGAAFETNCVDSSGKTGAVLLTAGLGTLCAIGAGTGFGKATRCAEVKQANLLCIRGDEAACLKLNSAWKPTPRAPAAPPAPAAAPAPVAPPVPGT